MGEINIDFKLILHSFDTQIYGFCMQLNENLLKNQEMWKAKISEIEER